MSAPPFDPVQWRAAFIAVHPPEQREIAGVEADRLLALHDAIEREKERRERNRCIDEPLYPPTILIPA